MLQKIILRLLIPALVSGIFVQGTIFGQTVIDDSFYSPSLDQTRYVDVYLPPGYYNDSTMHYPVIFYLHGWGGSQNDLANIVSYTEQKINNGEIDPVIMVCASNYTTPFDGSMYVNSPVWGNFEDYMINDLIAWLDTTYRTVPARDYRSLFGHSMGAYGAFRYGSLHNDKFCALSAYAAPANMELIIGDFQTKVKSENSGPPYTYNYNNTGNYTKMMFLGSGAWSPNLNSPQDYVTPQIVEFPFDQQGALIDTVFEKWYPGQVTTLVQSISPSDSVGILFGCGTNDELFFYQPNLALKDTLDNLGLPYEFISYSGGHSMPAAFKNETLLFLDSIMPGPVDMFCPDPSGLLADNVTDSSADLSWTENGTNTTWQIMLDISGFDTTGFIPDTVTANPYTFTGLSGYTTYDWYVRSANEWGYYSNWVGPVTFTTLPQDTTQTIQLIAGWNINSFFVTPDTMDMLNIYDPLVSSGELIKITDEVGGFVQYIAGVGWINTIGDMALTEGYYVKVDTATQLQVTGTPQLSSYDIPFMTGWNIMGYPLNESQDAIAAVQPLIDSGLLIKVIDETGGFIQNIEGYGWINTIGNFAPGEGYYIKVTNSATLTLDYPAASNLIAHNNTAPEPVLFNVPFEGNPYRPMNIVVNEINISNMAVNEGDEIAVFDNGICVGAGVISRDDAGLYAMITAAMDDPTTEEIDGYMPGDFLAFKYMNSHMNNPVELENNEIAGTAEYQPFETYVCSLAGSVTGIEESLAQVIELNCYPNPVKDKLAIGFNSPAGEATIIISDISGHEVARLTSRFGDNGNHTVIYPAGKLSGGFYVIKLQTTTSKGTYTGHKKFIKM
ncbi:MAG: hypothetical protein GXO86_09905 [Chlorobi bacterium]|nr:hypothetical protein [Chlorobiota bacterium]